MSHSKRAPYFPANLQYYAPWVAIHGLVAPYGQCQCGCGQPAPIAHKTYSRMGRRKGQPSRFVHGHNARPFDPAPDGFKTCSGCGAVKPLSQFYINTHAGRQGHYSLCQECCRIQGREYYHQNRDKRLPRQAEYRLNNKEALVAAERARRADPKYRAKKSATLHNWRERNAAHVAAYNRSLPVKARSAVNKAVRKGELPPPATMVCEHCQEALAAHYHHPNGYKRGHWFDIVALCTECHGKAHWRE